MPKKTSTHFDMISIGDTSLDTFLKIHNASLLCSLDKESCWFCLNYADKIPVDEIHFTPGGNACNNAVGSSRLGLKTGLYTIIGDDDSGRRIFEIIKKEGVHQAYIKVQKGGKTNYSTVLMYKTDRTILVYHNHRTYQLPQLAKTRWVYLTSMGKGFERIHVQLIRYLNKNGTKLAFNPGTHQLLAGEKSFESLLGVCGALILNKEEALTVLGTNADKNIKNMLRGLHHFGPEVVVVTDGAKGAFGFDGKSFYRMLPMPAHVVERTGAGDAFSTGLLAALCHDLPLQKALMWGAANAASVIEHIGPQAGLLTKKQMEKRCRGHEKRCKKL